jgi:hypothetical protein
MKRELKDASIKMTSVAIRNDRQISLAIDDFILKNSYKYG